MSPAIRPRPIHVERTGDPAVLRWVCHEPVLSATPPGHRRPGRGGPLHALVADGSIDDVVVVRDGDVFVRAVDPTTWRTVAPRVQVALLRELDDLGASPGHWLVRADAEAETPSVAEIQRLVDRAAGTVTRAHGGAITVAAVDGTTVHLRASGACHGCRSTDDTLLGLISPAIRSVHPAIVEVVLDAPAETAPAAPVSEPVRTPRRRRRAAPPSCH